MAHKSNLTMRHCMVVYSCYPLGETRVQREAEVLVKHGYEVDVICMRLPGEPAVGEYKGVKIYREKYQFPFASAYGTGLIDKFFYYLRFFLSAGIRLTQLNNKRKYSTIQVHNMPDFLVFCTLIPKMHGIPILLDLHELMPEFYASHFGMNKSIAAWLIQLQEHLACRFADHLITVSEICQQTLIKRGVPEKKCSVVMNVADEYIFHPSEKVRYKPHGRGSFRLIYHGSFVERNGLDLVIQAVGQVRSDIPGIHLTLVGRGQYLSHMKHMIDELGLEQHISIDDLRLAEDLPRIIMSCHLGVVPIQSSVFSDIALPTKLMEYAALGLPAVAARTTANLTYFSNSNTEFFEPGNVDDLVRCIRLLYHNPDRMIELARRSQNFNQRYNWAKIGAEYVALVKRFGTTQGLIDN